MRTKVEKLRDVSPQDLVGIYAANPHEPEADRKVLMAIIYGLVVNQGCHARILDSTIKDGLENPELIKMEKIKYEINIPGDNGGLELWWENSL